MRRHKYNARKTMLYGIPFDSQAEAMRYAHLKTRFDAGEIQELELQVEFDCIVNGARICKYYLDFRYTERGAVIHEDVKGFRTREFIIKKKLVEALFDITIHEIKTATQEIKHEIRNPQLRSQNPIHQNPSRRGRQTSARDRAAHQKQKTSRVRRV